VKYTELGSLSEWKKRRKNNTFDIITNFLFVLSTIWTSYCFIALTIEANKVKHKGLDDSADLAASALKIGVGGAIGALLISVGFVGRLGYLIIDSIRYNQQVNKYLQENGYSYEQFNDAIAKVDKQSKKIEKITENVIFTLKEKEIDSQSLSKIQRNVIREIVKNSIIRNADIFEIEGLKGKDKLELINTISEKILVDKEGKLTITDQLFDSINDQVKKSIEGLRKNRLSFVNRISTETSYNIIDL
jgi:hypothetical protein